MQLIRLGDPAVQDERVGMGLHHPLTTRETQLAEQMGVGPEELLYCGFRVLEASAEDEEVRRDCLGMVLARRSQSR